MWGCLVLFSMLALPQLLGVLVYFRLRRFHNSLAHAVGFLLSPTLFFYLAILFWVYLPSKADPDRTCGTAQAFALLSVYFLTAVSMIGSLIFQLVLHGRKLE